jgi:hypothetical protein
MSARALTFAGVVVLAVIGIGGCTKPDPPPPITTTVDAGVPAALVIDTHHLDDEGARVLAEIATLETTKDVTCWTSFRQLDSFISSNPYSNFAVLAKIAAVKALLRASWEKASRISVSPILSAADFAAAIKLDADTSMTDAKKKELASFATDLGMKAYKDYRTTSEHWRVLLAVIGDELVASGKGTTLKPVSADGLGALAELATRLSLLVLESAGQLARDERSPMIEGAHVKRAHAALSQRLDLVNAPRETAALSAEETIKRVAPLTKTLIEGKIRALQIYNKDSKDLLTDLNRVSKVPVTQDALDTWMKDLQSFTHFVAGGYEPMQSDNFLADGDFAPKDQPRRPWVDATRAENVTLQLFPHVIMPNGDVKVRFEPNPGAPADKPRKAFDELMLDYQQNAVRDTAIHWIVMQNVYREKPFAMDAFAAEYLSEVLSIMVTHYLVRAEQLAKAATKKSVDKEIARSVRDKAYVMVMPRSEETKAWTPEQWKKKDAVLARYPQQLFKDVTATSGLPTTAPKLPERSADAGAFDIQQAMGAGIAVGDLDNDGYPDLFIAGEGMGRLYLNRGKEAPGKFRDATEAWGIPAALDDSHGALFVDLDGDGALDLLVMRSEHPSLVLQQKGGKLVDVAAQVGLVTHRGAHVAQVFDYDGDGDLDVYVGYYGSDAANRNGAKKNVPSMDGRNGSPHELWKRGPDGHYTEVAKAAGVADPGWTLATSTFDYDGDGDQDLFLANDFGADVFYQNNGNGTFQDVAQATGTADRGSGMNVSVTDVNGDGFPDFYVSNIDMFSKNIKVVFPDDNTTINNYDSNLQKSFQYLSGNKLFVNPADPAGKKAFVADQGMRFEPGDRGWSWAAVFFDYENDGDEDMYLSTGWLESSFAANQKKQMFLLDDGVFYLAPPTSAEAFASNGRSAIAADLDRDGDLDLVLSNFRQAPVVLDNLQASGNHAITLRLRGKPPNTGAIGARVMVSAGGKKQRREVSGGNGYLGQNDQLISVGIGNAASADVVVRWPNGKEETVSGVAPGAVKEIVQDPPPDRK